MTLANRIVAKLQLLHMKEFNLSELYKIFPEEKETTIRGRIYRDLLNRKILTKKSRGIYSLTLEDGTEGVVIQGDARKLDFIPESSVDLIIADHPYQISTSGNKNFTKGYTETIFEYNEEDFRSKARVLRDGGFLVEFLPEMKETNFHYISRILLMAEIAGFKFYAKVPWYKAEERNGKLIDYSAFVGRKAVMEEVYIFSKGKPRALRERRRGDKIQLERGAKEMFPAVFMYKPVAVKSRVHLAEKPLGLLNKIIECLSKKKDTVLDQFSGSFNCFWSALKLGRNAIAIEIQDRYVQESFLKKHDFWYRNT